MLHKIFFALTIFSSVSAAAQVTMPYTNCPSVVAIARPGFNAYNNEPVSFYTVNTTTGAATLFPGGPLKDPANPANNLDLNGVGLNGADGFFYGMGTGSPTPKFYRVGANYSIEQLGVLVPPAPVSPANFSIINAAAGEIDATGNYYFTAVTGQASFFPTLSFTPQDYYIGKIAVTALVSGSGNINPVYTKIDFSNANCSNFYSTISGTMTVQTAQNTGLRDLVYNVNDNKLYTYVSFESPAGSGNFNGELMRINISTGVVECYPVFTLAFASASNEVAGTAITLSNEIKILFTDGSLYKADMSGPTTYTGTISPAGNTGITGGLRGDLASCTSLAAGPVAVNFGQVTATESDCKLRVNWNVGQEQNIIGYDVEQAEKNRFVSVAHIAANHSGASQWYTSNIPVNASTMRIRIRATQSDGSYLYSEIISVKTTCGRVKSMTVIDNAAVSNDLQLLWNNFLEPENFTVNIYSATGARVSGNAVSISGLNNISTVNVSRLPAGVYLVQTRSASGESFSGSFIKK